MLWQGLASPTSVPYTEWRFWALMIGLYVAASVNSVCALLDSVSISKVWVPFICEKDDSELRRTNAALRRINLFCDVAAPFCFGSLLSFLPVDNSLSISIIVVVLWNAVSFVPELLTVRAIYLSTPQLSQTPVVPLKPRDARNNPLLLAKQVAILKPVMQNKIIDPFYIRGGQST
jgi:hypothetical protein